MAVTAKITAKGQVTIPKKIREILKSETVEFNVIDGTVVIKPVKSVGGALKRYANKYEPLKDVREKVWEDVVNERKRNS